MKIKRAINADSSVQEKCHLIVTMLLLFWCFFCVCFSNLPFRYTCILNLFKTANILKHVQLIHIGVLCWRAWMNIRVSRIARLNWKDSHIFAGCIMRLGFFYACQYVIMCATIQIGTWKAKSIRQEDNRYHQLSSNVVLCRTLTLICKSEFCFKCVHFSSLSKWHNCQRFPVHTCSIYNKISTWYSYVLLCITVAISSNRGPVSI